MPVKTATTRTTAITQHSTGDRHHDMWKNQKDERNMTRHVAGGSRVQRKVKHLSYENHCVVHKV